MSDITVTAAQIAPVFPQKAEIYDLLAPQPSPPARSFTPRPPARPIWPTPAPPELSSIRRRAQRRRRR